MAIINGATTPQAIANAWKMSIWKVMKVRLAYLFFSFPESY